MIITDEQGAPRFALNSHSLLREQYEDGAVEVRDHCCVPQVSSSREQSILDGIRVVQGDSEKLEQGVGRIHLFWPAGEGARRIITSRDFVDWLSRGILFPAEGRSDAQPA